MSKKRASRLDPNNIIAFGQPEILAVDTTTKELIEQLIPLLHLRASLEDFNNTKVTDLEDIVSKSSQLQKNSKHELEKFLRSFCPTNIATISWSVDDLRPLIYEDGISLHEVPSAEIAELLIKAETSEDRVKILDNHWQDITLDCKKVLVKPTKNTNQFIDFCRSSLMEALDVLELGYSISAQALATVLIDTMFYKHFGKDRRKHQYNQSSVGQRNQLAFAEWLTFQPLIRAYVSFHPDKGISVPSEFNRHATVHAAGPKQFTRHNAVKSLMIATGILCFFDKHGIGQVSKDTRP